MRRALTIPTLLVVLALALALVPVALPIALVVDLARFAVSRKPFMASRLYAFGCLYLLDEALGLGALLAIWIAAGVGPGRVQRLADWTYVVQRVWASVLFVASRALLGLRYQVEGDGEAARGPLIVLIQHTSTIDTLVPTNFITARHGLRLRFVLKKELLVSPCLDVAGHRLPNVFVDRSSTQTEREVANIRALARALSPREGVLIYPEGTRFTPEKLKRAVEKLRAASDASLHVRASGLRHVLPPRLGGTLALLDAAPSADVLLVAHRGLEGFEKVTDLWGGGLVDGVVKIRMWRVPRAEVPTDAGARVAWLYGAWQRVDDWLEAEGAAS